MNTTEFMEMLSSTFSVRPLGHNRFEVKFGNYQTATVEVQGVSKEPTKREAPEFPVYYDAQGNEHAEF
jgi:hypothetical protein